LQLQTMFCSCSSIGRCQLFFACKTS